MATGDKLSLITDDVTGVRVGIPRGLVGAPRESTHGRNWRTTDSRLEIDTLRFRDRTLEELYNSLRSKKNRSISRGDLDKKSFVIEGTDGGDTTVYVMALAAGNEIRGISIVYSNRARNELRDTVEAVKRSFVAFPEQRSQSSGTATTGTPSIKSGERGNSLMGLDIAVDTSTGIKIGIPTELVGAPNDATYGRNWKTTDSRLEIDTLRFRDRTLEELYKALRGKKNRSISKADLSGASFVLEGEDGGDTTIYVTAEVRGDEIRGISIVYSNSARSELRDTVEAVKRSFAAFPAQSSEPAIDKPMMLGSGPAPPPDPLQEIQRRMTQLEQLKAQLEAAQQVQATHEHEIERLKREKQSLEEQFQRRQHIEKIGLDELPVHELPQGKRIALVVGVNNYANLGAPLKTAVADAVAVGKALKAMNFIVVEALDPDRRKFYDKWDQFLKDVEGGATAAFYFAGHGIQIAQVNYLLPADVASESADEDRVRRNSLNFNELRDELQTHRPALALFILDACRNNPYRASQSRALSVSRGLAQVSPTRGSFIMYSAEAGEEALDHLASDAASDVNSVYTRKLVPLLTTSMTLQSIALRVRADVQALAGSVRHVQTPAYYDGLAGLLCMPEQCATKNLKAQNAAR